MLRSLIGAPAPTTAAAAAVLLVAWLAVWLPRTARAAEPDGAAASAEVDALIQRAIQLRKSGDDRGALPELRKAYDLAPSPRTAAQLGLVEQALGRWDEAELHLAEALRSTSDPWLKKHRAVLEKALTIVRDHTASVQVSGDPEGATVFVNGRRVGQLPLKEPIRVIAGEVDVELRAEGYKRGFQKVSIDAYQFRALVIRLDRVDDAAGAAAGRVPDKGAGAVAPGVGAGNGAGAVNGGGPPGGDKPDSPPDQRPASGRSLRATAGWITAGAGGVVLAGGLVLALVAQSKMDDAIEDAGRANMTGDAALYMKASEAYSDAEGQRTAGRVMLVIGGALAVGGLVVALTAPKPEAATATATAARSSLGPWLAPGAAGGGAPAAGGGLAWSGTF